MKVKIHRGNEIEYSIGKPGMVDYTLVEIATETTKIILECGWNLPPTDDTSVIGDVKIEGLTMGDSTYAAVFVTHHHSGHHGIVESINADIPIYMSSETKNVLDVVADFSDAPLPRVDKHLEHGGRENVGDISVLPISVDHRVMGRMLFLIEADGQKLLYTQGFKHIDPAYYAMIGKIDALLCEGVNISAPDDMSVSDMEHEASQIMKKTNGHVFVLCSATDAERLKYIERACRMSGRTLAIDPFLKSIQERVTNPLFIEPVGFIPPNMEMTPRIQKHMSSNRDMEFVNVDYYSSLEIAAKMTNLTFIVRQSSTDFVSCMAKLTPLSSSTLISVMWDGYKNVEPVRQFTDLCELYGMQIETLKTAIHGYRNQLKTAILQLDPKVLVLMHNRGVGLFLACLDRVITLDGNDVLDLKET